MNRDEYLRQMRDMEARYEAEVAELFSRRQALEDEQAELKMKIWTTWRRVEQARQELARIEAGGPITPPDPDAPAAQAAIARPAAPVRAGQVERERR